MCNQETEIAAAQQGKAVISVDESFVSPKSNDPRVMYWMLMSGAQSDCKAMCKASTTQEENTKESPCELGKHDGTGQSTDLQGGEHQVLRAAGYQAPHEDVSDMVSEDLDALSNIPAHPSGNLQDEAIRLLAASVRPICDGDCNPEPEAEDNVVYSDWEPAGDDTMEREHQYSIILAACDAPPVTHNATSWPQYPGSPLCQPGQQVGKTNIDLWLPPGDLGGWHATLEEPAPPESSRSKEEGVPRRKRSIVDVSHLPNSVHGHGHAS